MAVATAGGGAPAPTGPTSEVPAVQSPMWNDVWNDVTTGLGMAPLNDFQQDLECRADIAPRVTGW